MAMNVRKNTAGDVLALIIADHWNTAFKVWTGDASIADASLNRRLAVREPGAVGLNLHAYSAASRAALPPMAALTLGRTFSANRIIERRPSSRSAQSLPA